jgi:hypothetical protein
MSSHRLVRAAAAAIILLTGTAPFAWAAPKRTKTPTRSPSPARPAATPTPAGPKPATLVPDPAYVGTPAAGERPYEAIVRAKEAGASDDELLARVAKENVRYSLSTPDIQKLRAAGVGPRVIEAMLRSGRTPVPTAAGAVSPAMARTAKPQATRTP